MSGSNQESEEDINMGDYFKIHEDWELLKQGFEELESEVDSFLRVPHKKKSGIDARKKTIDLKEITSRLKKNIVRKRKEYQSDYS
jgi:hypothetical protein